MFGRDDWLPRTPEGAATTVCGNAPLLLLYLVRQLLAPADIANLQRTQRRANTCLLHICARFASDLPRLEWVPVVLYNFDIISF